MADSIPDTLADLAGKSKDIANITKSLREFEAARRSAMSSGDVKAYTQLTKIIKANEELVKSEYARLDVERLIAQQVKDGKKLSDSQIQKYDAEIAKNEELRKSYEDRIRSVMDQRNKERISIEKTKQATKELFENHTVLGKGTKVVGTAFGSVFGKLMAGMTVWNAYKTFTQAAELRNNIMIQSFKDMGKYSKENIGTAANEARKFAAALAEAKSAAARLGMDVDAVAGTMLKFAKITGTKDAEALKTLTIGANGVSKALGIDVSEAVDFVKLRMDKFGGSASSAIVALNEINKESRDLSSAFTNVTIRGDDIVQTLLNISRESTTYAIDQRLIGQILRDNVARLQAQGESYDNARKKAEAYAEVVAGGKAPEWMRILSGQKVLGDMQKVYQSGGAEAFIEKYGEELDAAKPGLSKKVAGILGDPSMQYWDKMQLVQELTQATSVGIKSMNGVILDTYKQSGQSLAVMADQMGVSYEVAHGMVQEAKDFEAREKEIATLTKASTKQLAEKLGYIQKYGQEEGMRRAGEITSIKNEKERKKLIEGIVDVKREEDSIKMEAERMQFEDEFRDKARKKSEEAIGRYEKQLAQSKLAGDTDSYTIKALEKKIKDEKAKISQLETKVDDEKGLKTVEEINTAILKEAENSTLLSGNFLSAIQEKLGSIEYILLGAISLFVAKRAFSFFTDKMASKTVGNVLKGGTFNSRMVEGVLTRAGEKSSTKLGGMLGKVASTFPKTVGYAAKGVKLLGVGSAIGAAAELVNLKTAADKSGESVRDFATNAETMSSALKTAAGIVGMFNPAGLALAAAMQVGDILVPLLDSLSPSFRDLGTNLSDAVIKGEKGIAGAAGTALNFINGILRDDKIKTKKESSKEGTSMLKASGHTFSQKQFDKWDAEAKKRGMRTSDYIREQKKTAAEPDKKSLPVASLMKDKVKDKKSLPPPANAMYKEVMKGTTLVNPNEDKKGIKEPTTKETTYEDTRSMGEPSGEFIGGVSPDGSATLKITNFGNIYSQARRAERNNVRKN